MRPDSLGKLTIDKIFVTEVLLPPGCRFLNFLHSVNQLPMGATKNNLKTMKLTSIKSAIALSVAIATTAAGQSTIIFKGSDTLGNKLVPQLKAEYLKDNKGVDIEITPQGSGHAFTIL